jgi:hypothetical protein
MRKTIARRQIKSFEERYGYDATYMTAMLDEAPAAFFKFAKILPASSHRRRTPKEAYFAVKVVAALSEDCGPCTQLVVEMAREAGMEDGQIEAVLRGDEGRMSADTLAGYRFASTVAHRDPAAGEARTAVRERWGAESVVELSLCFAIGRVFPVVKTAMGHGATCRVVEVSGRRVDVHRAGVLKEAV